MTRYKQAVREHLQPHLDAGMTHAAIARALNLESVQLVSMVLNPMRKERLAMKRLPALKQLCSFSDERALQLLGFHAREYGGGDMDLPLLHSIVRWTDGSLRRRRKGKGGGSHGSH